MENIIKHLGIIVLIAVIGFSITGCKNDNTEESLTITDTVMDGTFSLTNIPSQFNGKYAVVLFEGEARQIFGGNYDTKTEESSPVQISNGSVNLPMWIVRTSDGWDTFQVEKYKGNETIEGLEVYIYDFGYRFLGGRHFVSVTFKNGGATRAWATGVESVHGSSLNVMFGN